MPESPRWLVDQGHMTQAQQVLQKARGVEDVSEELEDIKRSVKEFREKSLGEFYLIISLSVVFFHSYIVTNLNCAILIN